MPRSDPVAAFKDLLDKLPGDGSGVELLLAGLPAERARLLRLCAIPHQFDTATLSALAPDLDLDAASREFAALSRLAVVIGAGEQLGLHDNARAHLFRQWLRPDRRVELKEVSASLSRLLLGSLAEARGDRRDELEDELLFHRMGVDLDAGFQELERLLAESRHAFRFTRCSKLIRLAEEYRPILSPTQGLWLDYHSGVLAADQGNSARALNLFEAVLADSRVSDQLWIKATTRVGYLAEIRSDWARAVELYQSALDRTVASELEELRPGLLRDLASAHRETDVQAAERFLLEALGSAKALGDSDCQASCLNALGTVKMKLGDSAAAIDAFHHSIELLEQSGQRFQTAQVRNNLGMAYLRRGDLDAGEGHLSQSLDLKREAGDSLGQANTLTNLMEVLRRQGRAADAFDAGREAVRLFDQLWARREAGVALRSLGQLHRENERPDLAREAFQESERRLADCGADSELAVTRAALKSMHAKSPPWLLWVLLVGVLVGAAVWLMPPISDFLDTEPTGDHSADMHRWAFIDHRGARWFVDLDGESYGPYDEILVGSPRFSPDGSRVVYGARKAGVWRMYLDGRALRAHEELVTDGFAFSVDGKRFAYAAVDDSVYRVYEGDAISNGYDQIFSSTVLFSPDGRHVSFRVRRGDRVTLVIDGNEEPWFDQIALASSIFSPDSARVGYSAARQGGDHWQAFMMIDGVEGPAYDHVWDSLVPLFSADSRRSVYAALRGDEVFVVVDGAEGRAYDQIGFGSSFFSLSGNRTGYFGQRDGRFYMVIDGQESGPYDDFLEGSPVFGPRGKRVAYGIVRGEDWFVVVDGVEHGPWEGILQKTPIFSPEGEVAYSALRNGYWWVVVGEDEYGPYYFVEPGSLRFSADGLALIYLCGQNWYSNLSLMLGGREIISDYDGVWPPVFDGPRTLRYLSKPPGGPVQSRELKLILNPEVRDAE